MVLPFIFLLQNGRGTGDFFVAFSGAYLGLIPLLALTMLKYSQQWQASDIFRSAPMLGPAEICHGARRAVLCFLTLPMLVVIGAVILLVHGPGPKLLLLLPGVVALPVYALVPGLIGKAIPLSAPIEEGKSAGRGLTMMSVMFISFALAGIADFMFSRGWFWPFLAAETIIVIGVYAIMRYAFKNVRWQSAE
jgi:hypothetical protein